MPFGKPTSEAGRGPGDAPARYDTRPIVSPDMSALQPTSTLPPSTAEDDPRVGHLLDGDPDEPSTLSAALVGFPVDEGVVRNGGRPGASEGPERIREALFAMTPDARSKDAFQEILRNTADAGNLTEEGPLTQKQAGLGTVLAPYLARGVVPLVLGGGHETAYGHFLGYVEAERDVAILNWDAHVDVRPLVDGRPHSGSSFRQALTHPSGVCRDYTVAGLLPHSTSAAHLDFVDQHDGEALWGGDLSESAVEGLYKSLDTPTMVTFDLDAVDQAYAPGVSAPSVGGLDQEVWFRAAYCAGRCPHVASVDVAELNPRVDPDQRTARLAARTVWEIVRGLADRRRPQ